MNQRALEQVDPIDHFVSVQRRALATPQEAGRAPGALYRDTKVFCVFELSCRLYWTVSAHLRKYEHAFIDVDEGRSERI